MTIAFVMGGALVGFLVGVWRGEREGGDYNFAPALYGPGYAVFGAILGAIAAELID